MNLGLNTLGGGLSLVRILGSISKTLGIVRQVAPIYKEVKPILSKAPLFLAKISNMRNSIAESRRNMTTISPPVTNSISYGQTEGPTASYPGGPVFFQ